MFSKLKQVLFFIHFGHGQDTLDEKMFKGTAIENTRRLFENVKNIKTYQNKLQPRGLSWLGNKWSVTDEDGKIAIPFSFHSNFSTFDEERVIQVMSRMNDDLGCLKTIHVPKSEILNRFSAGHQY